MSAPPCRVRWSAPPARSAACCVEDAERPAGGEEEAVDYDEAGEQGQQRSTPTVNARPASAVLPEALLWNPSAYGCRPLLRDRTTTPRNRD